MTILLRKFARACQFTGADALLRRVPGWDGVLSLAYHRIGTANRSAFDHGLWSADADAFDAQVAFLKKHCDVIGPAELEEVARKRRGRFALITFDDGYRDNYDQAFPILRSHGVGGVFFVTTGFVDSPRLAWWDEIAWMVRSSTRPGIPAGDWLEADVTFDEPLRERAVRVLLRKYKSLAGAQTDAYLTFLAGATGSGRYAGEAQQSMWMTWDMLREMKAGGMWIGGHTVNHPILSRLPRDQQQLEISGCRSRLEAELGAPVTWFSYPVGGPQAINDDTRASLKEAGMSAAFTYYGGYQRLDEPWDWYDLRRVAVETDVNRAEFRSIVSFPRGFARAMC